MARLSDYEKRRKRENKIFYGATTLGTICFFVFLYWIVVDTNRQDREAAAKEARIQTRMVNYANTICGQAPRDVDTDIDSIWKVECQDGTTLLLDRDSVEKGIIPQNLRDKR